ncbi:HlyD family efflux transporter periplasmic adaptor subunit [Feifania hominis]|uniref:HlyD family secretion protein n=1 Tax=Feifania hominis TaxID=2763660 RepID=A0A926DFC6_9FIRM|nr:HlyD family efflux transporter periplasmic adaptor subunit [Feifania hominis]MBC8536816.1 hypothetical protein [Feifania hominis]
MRRVIGRIIATVVVLAAAAFLALQLFRFSLPEYQTETAELYSASEETAVQGLLIREEQLIAYPADPDAAYEYLVDDGVRVAKGGKIATVYRSQEDLSRRLEVTRLTSKIENLERVVGESAESVVEIASIEQDINSLILSVHGALDENRGDRVSALEDELHLAINKKKAIMGGSDELLAEIAALTAERDRIQSTIQSAETALYAPEAGYFVKTTDGYETQLLPDEVENLTVERLTQLMDMQVTPTDEYAGKVVTDYQWFFACVLTDEQCQGLTQGQKVSLRFPFLIDESIPATLDILREEHEGNLAVFSSYYVLNEINLLRSQTVQIVRDDHQGLKVNSSALRVVDGESGVFTLSGSVIEFKPVNILYAKDNYVIVEWDQNQKGGLKLYDEVIVKGKDLYDGKVIN